MTEQRQKVLAHHPAHHVADGQLPRFLIGIGHEHLAHQPPILPVRFAPGLGGARLDRFPMASDIGRVEVEAHRDKAALTRQL